MSAHDGEQLFFNLCFPGDLRAHYNEKYFPQNCEYGEIKAHLNPLLQVVVSNTLSGPRL